MQRAGSKSHDSKMSLQCFEVSCDGSISRMKKRKGEGEGKGDAQDSQRWPV